VTQPLISHPNADAPGNGYPPTQLSEAGHLLLAAHNGAVVDRAERLYGDASPDEQVALRTLASLHDFGKATPQFQARVRPGESHDGPEEETHHARLGALATWYVLDDVGIPERDRLAATLAVARHHQALPNAAQYTAETLATAFEADGTTIQAQVDGISGAWPEAATGLLQQTPVKAGSWDEFAEWVRSGDAAAELRDASAHDILGGYDPRPEQLPTKLYDRTLHYWSALTLADKTHAMDVPEGNVFELDTLDRDAIERYVAALRRDPPDDEQMRALNAERERARRQAIRGVHEWLAAGSETTEMATLTLPTGLGKTFTGLSAAFEARDILAGSGEDAADRPIIYALPYTSIIEQTRELFEDPDLWGADPQMSALTVHHYLSETVVRHGDHDQNDVDDTDAEETAHLLGEAWRDGTVLTTFVQLFESLTGPSNRQGLKLPALESGLVILDEPQALPKDWWNGIQRLLELLTEEYGTRVLAMTATQPTLVRSLDSVPLLAAGLDHDTDTCCRCRSAEDYPTTLPPAPSETYFEEARRVQYRIHGSALAHQPDADAGYVDHDTAASRLLDAATPSGSTLAVCNTITSSRELTEAVRERPGVTHIGDTIADVIDDMGVDATTSSVQPTVVVDRVLDEFRPNASEGITSKTSQRPADGDLVDETEPDSEVVLLTLNSRFRPFDRRVIIELADRLSTADRPFVLVSTQAIEAGVDLSFETVFRDLAPLDSIVQAAGRCNRSYEWGPNGGTVEVWTLADPDEETPAAPTSEPPAYYVYEQGATDDGIPGHLQLISEVLSDIDGSDGVPDIRFARDAVDRYFEALEAKSLSAGDLRANIEAAQGRWLARQSLVGGRETVDVLVAWTEAERNALDELTDQFVAGDPAAFDGLQEAAGLRVSVPADVIEEAPSVGRLDAKSRGDDGVNVFRFTGSGGLEYDLATGGLRSVDEGVGGRFTV